MIQNYFKTAWRNLLKHRFYSIVNIVGLFAGITFTMLIGAYVWGELQVNKKLRNVQNQYILTSEWKDPNMGYDIAALGPLAKRLKEDYPNIVKNYYRFDGITSAISKGDKYFRESIQLGDCTLLNMYGFTLLFGDVKTAFDNPNAVILSKDMALKYFGKTDIIGETITIESFAGGKKDFVVTGVLNDIAENSVTQLNSANINTFFVPINAFTYFGRNDLDAWRNNQIISYVELQDGVSAKKLEQPIRQLLAQHTSGIIQENLTVHPVLLTDYYLSKNNGLVKRMLYTLSFVAFFILLMAIVNFINMAISSSSARVREIGVRKVMGGERKQIIFQFLIESTVLVFIATVLSLLAYPLLRPLFAGLIGKPILSLYSFPVYFVLIPVAIIVVVGLLAGLYPAFILSSIKSADAVKGKLKSVKESILLRKSLVGFQFSIAMLVMIAAYIITQQLDHFFNGQLGYNKEFILTAQVPRDWTNAGVQKMETVRNEFAALPQINSVTLSYEIPNGNNGGNPPVYKMGEDSTRATPMQLLITDQHYLNTYQIPIKAGNFFSDLGNDSGKIVVNEKAVEVLGFKNAAAAIGGQVKVPGDPTIFTIKGVTNNFHFGSMQQAIAPVLFFNVQFAPNYRYLSFKIKPGNIPASIAAIQKKWSQLLPASSFEYSFMEETLKNLYATEIQLKKAAFTATILSLIIVLLGVLGLVSLTIHKRIKEISIRKVLGASVPNITSLFIKDFMLVVLIAAVVACPLAYYIMTNWLNNYAYRINLTAQPFLWPIILLALVTLLLIGLQTLKAALANPIKNLKSE